MQLLASIQPPLPVTWNHSPGQQPSRRRRIGRLQLRDAALHRFNGALLQCDPLGRQLDADQIISAARNLCAEHGPGPIPLGIYARMRCTALLQLLHSDRDWQIDAKVAHQVELLLRHFTESDDLIPHDEPVIGHLDDAILVDAAWPTLNGEALDYLDYRRLRRVEAELRGLRPAGFHFSRSDWLEGREAERRLYGHQRLQGLDSYRMTQANSFRSFH